MQMSSPIVGVGAVIWRGPERLLLVRRGQPPRLNEWSLPGGRVEFGETLREALAREIAEETGLTVILEGLIDVVDLVERDETGGVTTHFVLADFSALWQADEASAGSDVAECGWFNLEDALTRVSWAETRRIIRLSARQLWQLDF
jgi:8-oxo-dGTP diphosphatase